MSDNKGEKNRFQKSGGGAVMSYQTELNFTIRALERMRLQVTLVRPGVSLKQLDYGLRAILGLDLLNYEKLVSESLFWVKQGKIYKLMDQFLCNYIFFLLPDSSHLTTVVIGPYLTQDPSREQLLETAEQLNIPMHLVSRQSELYASMPIFSDPSPIFSLVATLGESIWGSADSYEIEDINDTHHVSLPVSPGESPYTEETDILMQMEQMEHRYAYENQLMEIVSKGMTQQAEIVMSHISQLNFQQRLADPLRNLKNYCIICNTLMRKAAEQGGVHPWHLDKISGQFARTIENSLTLDAAYSLISEMLRTYTRLVRTHANRRYSPLIHKTLAYIEANLSGDLSLPILAHIQQVTPAYLSAIFHKETGHTLIDQINEMRMKNALHLLKTTRLQIQNIAQLCGIADPNYFTKLFKRFYGITPAQFRKDGV